MVASGPVNVSPKKVNQPKPLRLASSSGNRKLPSYAPQNSPAEPKVTVDYKQLIRGCKSYKSPGKEPKPNNLFEKFRTPNVHSGPSIKQHSRSPRKQHALQKIDQNKYLNEKSKSAKAKVSQSNSSAPLTAENSDRKYYYKNEIMQRAACENKSGDKPSLFEKFGDLSKPSAEHNSNSVSRSGQDAECLQGGDVDCNASMDNDFSQYDNNGSKTEGLGLVYRPGVGITSTTSGNTTTNQKKKPLTDSILNSSLTFYDPYNNSTPTATSPSKANLDDTFEYQLFKPIAEPSSKLDEVDEDNLPNSSQESVNASLVIEETSTASDAEEALLSDEEELPFSDEDEVPQLPETDEPSASDTDDLPQCATSIRSNKKDPIVSKTLETGDLKEMVKAKASPDKLWPNDVQTNKEVITSGDDAVFGKSELSPVKFRRTFQKKKASPEIIEIIKDEEDKIIEAEFKKDLEDQTRKKLFVETITERPVPGSSQKADTHSEESARSKRKKLVEDSPAKSSVSTTQENSANESDSRESSIQTPQKSVKSEDESECEDVGERKFHRQQKLEEIKQLKAKIFEKQWMQSKETSSSSSSTDSSDSDSEITSNSNTAESSESEQTDSNDSDYTINSDASVESETSENDKTETHIEANTSQNSDSDSLPKRKRKRLSSPLHSRERAAVKVKPVIDLIPQRQEENPEFKKSISKKPHSIDASNNDKLPSKKSQSKNYTIQIESTPSCKLKRKKGEDNSRDKVHSSKERPHQEKVHHKESKLHQKHSRDTEKLKRKHKLKPGANIRSDQIIPHQRKLAQKKEKLTQRKQKITDKYDARMCKNKEVDNLKTFYQKSRSSEENSLMSKYKKEVRLS